MNLTVLGNTGRYLAPLSGGSGYLVESDGGARVLLDCGGGVREALARREVARLDAVVLSHFHHDHVLDFPTVRDLLDAGTRVFVHPGEERRLLALADAYAFEGPFELPGPLVAAWPDQRHTVGDLTLSFAPMRHSAPCAATRLDGPSGSLVYASDTAPNASLDKLARNADLLLLHALIPDVEPESHHAGIHHTAKSAAETANRVGAARLLLSHRWHGSHDEDMLAAAKGHPDVVLARDSAIYTI